MKKELSEDLKQLLDLKEKMGITSFTVDRKLIEEIEKVQNTHIKVEVWSALFIYGNETSQIKMKVIETLKSREKRR